MDVKIRKGRIESDSTEAVVVSQFEGETALVEDALLMDKAVGGLISDAVAAGEFTGRLNQTLLIRAPGALPARRVLVVGLGKRAEFSLDRARQASGTAARLIRDLGIKTFATILHGRTLGKPSLRELAAAVTEGAVLGLYQFVRFRTENRDELKQIEQVSLVDRLERIAEVAGGAREGQIVAEAANLARDLGNTPANAMTPGKIAELAQSIAKEFDLGIEVLERADAERLGMGAFLAVARGSLEPPKFIILEYRGGRRKGGPVVLVGKTITFDSGGISIKPAENMHQMKDDMAGGAAVLCAIKAAAQLRLPISIVGILPATENMPSGSAIKPGDVVTSLSGKTIEIINTDAEGRLVLADGLTYAERYKPSAVVDIATLTGACVVALGNHATGAVTNTPRLLERLRRAGDYTG